MDREASFAVGTALTALGELLERKGLCTMHEVAETLATAAINAAKDLDFPGQSRYLGVWAFMARTAAEGAAKQNGS